MRLNPKFIIGWISLAILGGSQATSQSPADSNLRSIASFWIGDSGVSSQISAGSTPSVLVGSGRIHTEFGSNAPGGIAIFGFRPNGVLVTETGVPATSPTLAGRLYAEVGGGVNTGIAIANPNDQDAVVSFYLTNESGTNFGSGNTTIPARGQISRFLNESPFNGGESINGTFSFTANIPIGVVALRGLTNERNDFLLTTLPVSSQMPSADQTTYLPHFAAGGGWSTQVILVNPTENTIAGTIQFMGQGSATAAAQPVAVTVDGISAPSFSYSIPGRSSRKFQATGSGTSLLTGSVRIVASSGPSPSGLAVFAYHNGRATVSEAGVPMSQVSGAFRLYAELSGPTAGNIQTGLAVTNTSDTPANVNFELISSSGASMVQTGSRVIPGQGQIALFLNELQGFENIPTPFRGMLRISTASPAGVAVTGLRARINEHGDFLITTTPPMEENSADSGRLHLFPMIAEGGGYTTQFVLFNGKAGPTSFGTLQLFDQTGGPLQLALTGTAPSTPSSTLLHHYTFQDGAADSAGIAHGTLVGGAWIWSGQLDLSGTQAHVQFGDYLVPKDGSYSVAMLVRHATLQSTFVEWISQGASGGPPFYFGHNPSRVLRITDRWLNTGVPAAGADGGYHHYALVVDADARTTRVYVDGTPRAVLNEAISTTASGTFTRIGRQFGANGTEYHHGNIDEVRIYQGVLSDAEIAALAVPDPARPLKLTQQQGGLHGYASTRMDLPPASMTYGLSFYTLLSTVNPAMSQGVQIGLVGTWLHPDNRTFPTPLCPPGTFARDNWPERGPTWNSVFQTVEGGVGYWVSTHFPTPMAKFRINGTPDCYNTQISSPGWGFGGPALPAQKLGLVQLSNRLVTPPDGLTFVPTSQTAMLGYAWMALPLTPSYTRDSVPTGAQSWTVFLHAQNFKGPVAYYTPETWSALSSLDSTIGGRGLDAQPLFTDVLSIEVGETPMFELMDAGTRYRRIPQLVFPADTSGRTTLTQDPRFYGRAALHDAVGNWVANGGAAPSGFDTAASFTPTLSVNSSLLDMGVEGQRLPLDTSAIMQEQTFATPGGGAAYGLRWVGQGSAGVFPEYYREENGRYVAIPENQAPATLKQQAFRPAMRTTPYVLDPESPLWQSSTWRAGPFSAPLNDGSTVDYVWYRFIEQPAIARLGLDSAVLQKLQAWAESLHAQTGLQGFTMPPPTSGSLVTLDPNQFVTPPAGLEAGYVPIVIRQY